MFCRILIEGEIDKSWLIDYPIVPVVGCHVQAPSEIGDEIFLKVGKVKLFRTINEPKKKLPVAEIECYAIGLTTALGA